MFKIAIVGAGIIAKSHSEAILNNPDCELAAIADIVEEKAKEIAILHNAPYYTDYKEMCEKTKFDAVILNLPHFLHCEVSVYFMNKGINVLIEKPMAMNAAECDIMIEAAKRNNVKLAVGHVQRYHSAYRELKKIYETQELGKLCMISETRNVNYLPNRPKWFLDKKTSGGGIVMNFGAHSLDKIFYVTGLDVKNAHAVLKNQVSDDNVEINAQILLELTDDVSATINFCGCYVEGYEYTVSFYFTDGVARVLDGSNLVVEHNGKKTEIEGTCDLFNEQLVEFVKYLKGEPNYMATPEYGRKVMNTLDMIL